MWCSRQAPLVLTITDFLGYSLTPIHHDTETIHIHSVHISKLVRSFGTEPERTSSMDFEIGSNETPLMTCHEPLAFPKLIIISSFLSHLMRKVVCHFSLRMLRLVLSFFCLLALLSLPMYVPFFLARNASTYSIYKITITSNRRSEC